MWKRGSTLTRRHVEWAPIGHSLIGPRNQYAILWGKRATRLSAFACSLKWDDEKRDPHTDLSAAHRVAARESNLPG
jgi:hypothetical protein